MNVEQARYESSARYITQGKSLIHKVTPGNKLESRKAQRSERLTLYKELLKVKPDEKYEDPKDVAAIKYAQAHMGDYKLKTGDKYIVPENERVDTDKKKRQINLLAESIHLLKEVRLLVFCD